MSTYIFETQINTSQHFLMLPDRVAEDFKVHAFHFKISTKNFDKRPGLRYFVSHKITSSDFKSAYQQFMEKILRVTDSMAFFYSQPISVEYWNILAKKPGEKTAYLSAHQLRPTTPMCDYSIISNELLTLVDKVCKDDNLYNLVWLYNNNAKIDSVDYDPASRQFGLCQLIDALVDQETVRGCEACKKRPYTRTKRTDIGVMLGSDLYKKLYGGGDPLRNRLAHGSLTKGTFLDDNDVEEIILKICERMNTKYGLKNKVIPSMTDRIRATNTWSGHATQVIHNEKSLEELLEQTAVSGPIVGHPQPRDW